MSQDEVLKKWLERLSLTSHLDYFVDDQDSCSKAAMLCRFNENDIGRTWRAAVKHTLAFVAEEYRRRGDDDTAEFVMKLEP